MYNKKFELMMELDPAYVRDPASIWNQTCIKSFMVCNVFMAVLLPVAHKPNKQNLRGTRQSQWKVFLYFLNYISEFSSWHCTLYKIT